MEEKEPQVRIMTRSEKNDFDGVTIDEDTGKEETREKSEYQGSRILFHTIGWKDLFFGHSGWLGRLAFFGAILIIAGFLLFAVMPIVLVMLTVGGVIWLLLNLFFTDSKK